MDEVLGDALGCGGDLHCFVWIDFCVYGTLLLRSRHLGVVPSDSLI